ncbi:MAG TPA: zinc finger Ran-binding domain-containing protein [Waddliaceae bacterium]
MLKALATCFLIILTQMQFCIGNEKLHYFDRVVEIGGDVYLKYYVSANQIQLSEEGISILLGEVVRLQVEHLFHDEQGFYYLEEGVSWICSRCGALNRLDRSSCYRCGNPYGS